MNKFDFLYIRDLILAVGIGAFIVVTGKALLQKKGPANFGNEIQNIAIKYGVSNVVAGYQHSGSYYISGNPTNPVMRKVME